MDREIVDTLYDILNSIKVLTEEIKELKRELEKVNKPRYKNSEC